MVIGMVKIDMKMPSKCEDCSFVCIAFDSELYKEDEPYCNVKNESIEEFMEDETKPDWCPLIGETMKIYSNDVMKALRKCLDVEENDTSKDEEIMSMSKEKAFEYYCKWNGLSGGWYYYLMDAVESIFDVKLEKED
jgi:hypothetical protein